jgi:hypothetical protein
MWWGLMGLARHYKFDSLIGIFFLSSPIFPHL